MKRFFNHSDHVVTQAIDGYLRTHGNAHVARADAYPSRKFVVRTDWDKSRVAIISGGGAGHEPSHVGFVGKGMLTAAVSGEVFASPSVEAVLACILHVTGDAGCLLIVKNYTGDRLNFGLAAEKAKKMGKKVKMVIVADDIAIPDSKQPRGVAGTLFIHKIAGYLSEQEQSLDHIHAKLDEANQEIYSLGIALSTCTLPNQVQNTPVEAPELGLGIHGEPGVEKTDLTSGKEAVEMIIERLEKVTSTEKKYAVIINNLGSVTPLEMSIISDEILSSSFGKRIQLVIGPDLLMTSLNMYGFSLSLLALKSDLEEILLAPVAPRAWPQAVAPVQPECFDLSHITIRQQFEPSSNATNQAIIETICRTLIEAENDLNELDNKVGDGDTGSTFADGAKAILEEVQGEKLPLNDVNSLLLAIGELLGSHMGGSSGVLCSIFFTNAGIKMFRDMGFSTSLKSAANTMMEYGGAQVGSRTLLDALVPAIDSLLVRDLQEAAQAAREGANATSKMLKANAGRSAYLRAESLTGVTDPGAEAVARIFEALANVKIATSI